MSTMACRCGSVIRNTVVPCSTEGFILRDQDQENFQEAVSRDIAAFFAAVYASRRDAWIGEFFSPQYPTEESDEGIVGDIIALHRRGFTLSVAECERCGRLWVQRSPGESSYRSFTPDEAGYAGVLRSKAIQKAPGD